MISVLWLSSECDKQRSQTSESGVCILHRYPPYRLIMAWNGLSYLWACTDQSHCSGWIQWPWRHARSYFPTFKSSSGLTPKLSPLALWTVYLTGQWVSEHDAHMQRARPPVTNLLKSDQKTEEKKPNLIAERIPANTEANSYFTHQKTASENWIKCPQNPQNPHKRLLPL